MPAISETVLVLSETVLVLVIGVGASMTEQFFDRDWLDVYPVCPERSLGKSLIPIIRELRAWIIRGS